MARPHLPKEIILMIAQYLTPRGIASLMLVNRELYDLLRGGLIYDRTPGSARNGIVLWASQHGREDVLRAMLHRQGQFGYRDWDGFQLVSAIPTSELQLPLRFAAWYGHVEIIKILLDWDINTIQTDLRALPAAVSGQHLEAVRILLAYSANMPAAGSEQDFIAEDPPGSVDHLTPRPGHGRFLDQALGEAIRHQRYEIIEVLAADGRARISLEEAARLGSERFVKLSCTHEQPRALDQRGNSPLSAAAEAGHPRVLQILFDHGWDCNMRHKNGRTPLCIAAASGQESVVRMLLDRKDVVPDVVDNLGHTPLLEASRKGHVAIIDQLLRTQNVDANPATSSGQSALSFVAGRGIGDAVRLLLSAGAHPDTRDHFGRSPLSLAAGAGYPDVVRLLLATDRVDPDSRCKNSQTPLAYAVLSGHFPGRVNGEKINPNDDKDEREMLNILRGSLEGRMACLKVEEEGQEQGRDESVALSIMQQLLADHRVDPNSKDAKGRSVLCLAILRGELAAVRILLSSKKIDVRSKIYRNLTPIDLVREKYKKKRLSERWTNNTRNTELGDS